MKNIVQLHVGSFHRIISRLVDDIDVNIERKVPKLKFYNSQYVKNRLLQRFIELERVNIQLNASKFSGDIQGECFFNQSTVNLKYFKYSLESGILSIKLIFFLKSLLKFFMIWNKILFLYFVSLLKINCNNKKFTLVYGVHHDNFAGERKDKEFIRFCKKGPVSVLNNASHIIVQSHLKTISVEQKYAQYADNPLYFLLLNGKVSFNEFLTFFKNHLSMMFSYVKSCILFPPIAMLDDDFVNHALVDHLNRKSIIENIVITNSNGSCQPLWMNNLQDRYYRLHMAWYSQNTGFFQTFKWDPIRTPDMDIQKINVDAYYKLIKKYIDSDNIDRFEREMRNETGLDIDDIFNTFAGSFIANISGFGSIETTISDYGRYYNDSMYSDYDYYYDEYIYEGGYDWGYYEKDTTMTLPLFSVVFDMKDSYFIEEMIELGIDAGAITDGEYYSFDADGMNMFIDFNKTTFMVTNDQDAIYQFNNNGYNKHLSSSNNIVDNISYAYLNLDADKYSHLIEESFGGRMPREVEMMMDIWDDLFESVEFKQSINESSGTFSAEFKMSFKDKDKNILQTIFNLVEDNSREIYNIIN